MSCSEISNMWCIVILVWMCKYTFWIIKYTITKIFIISNPYFLCINPKLFEKEVQFISKSVTSTIHHVYVMVYWTYCTLTRLKLFFFLKRGNDWNMQRQILIWSFLRMWNAKEEQMRDRQIQTNSASNVSVMAVWVRKHTRCPRAVERFHAPINTVAHMGEYI